MVPLTKSPDILILAQLESKSQLFVFKRARQSGMTPMIVGSASVNHLSSKFLDAITGNDVTVNPLDPDLTNLMKLVHLIAGFVGLISFRLQEKTEVRQVRGDYFLTNR